MAFAPAGGGVDIDGDGDLDDVAYNDVAREIWAFHALLFENETDQLARFGARLAVLHQRSILRTTPVFSEWENEGVEGFQTPS